MYPLSLCLEILLLGLYLLWFAHKQKAGKVVVTIGVGLIIIFSYGTFHAFLLQSLENKYPPLINLDDVDDVKWVVVLGGGNVSNPNFPTTVQLTNTSIVRLIEGMRIQKKYLIQN